jgi:glyceraldehyde-3-phosphate dehydrogenase/erythrose-4-phosphate dehydrogenase
MIKVAINGYGMIGKRVADAVAAQPDMKVIRVPPTKPSHDASDFNIMESSLDTISGSKYYSEMTWEGSYSSNTLENGNLVQTEISRNIIETLDESSEGEQPP